MIIVMWAITVRTGDQWHKGFLGEPETFSWTDNSTRRKRRVAGNATRKRRRKPKYHCNGKAKEGGGNDQTAVDDSKKEMVDRVAKASTEDEKSGHL